MAYGAYISLEPMRQLLKLLLGSALRRQRLGVECSRQEMKSYSNLCKKFNVRSSTSLFIYLFTL
jgi:hypothetical protein